MPAGKSDAISSNFSTGFRLAVKRAVDICLSSFILIALSPVLLGSAAAIKLNSPGPVMYRSPRRGLAGRRYSMLKFRSMYLNADELLSPEDRRALAETGMLPKSRSDPRVTPVGRILRSTSIDELPQLFNVLAGHMSLVGPRPVHEAMLAPYPEIAVARTRVKPGITGLWQINDRENNTSVLFMWPWDKQYMEHFSFRTDARILLATFRVVLSRKGAW